MSNSSFSSVIFNGEQCRPSILNPDNGDWREFLLDFNDFTYMDTRSVIVQESSDNLAGTLSLKLCQNILGGKIRRTNRFSTNPTNTWKFPGMYLGEMTRRIVERNEKVAPRLRLSVPYAQEFNGYTEDGQQRKVEEPLCSSIFTAVSLGVGINPETGSEHPIRPVQTKSPHINHDIFDHFILDGEIFFTARLRAIWRERAQDNTVDRDGTGILGPIPLSEKGAEILKFSNRLDRKMLYGTGMHDKSAHVSLLHRIHKR